MTWTEFTLTVTTPLFNHDDTDTGLRVASIRGAMRYWFRALAAHRVGNDIQTLAKEEQMVFGSTDRAAAVRLRVSNQPIKLVKPRNSDILSAGKEKKWIVYLLGQGHTAYDKENRTFATTRPCTKPPHRFRLQIAFIDEEKAAKVDDEKEAEAKKANALTMASLWLACTYGGFGARTRKGFGGVRLTHEDGFLPEPWTSENVDTPGIDHYECLDHLPISGPLEVCANYLPDQRPDAEGTTLGESLLQYPAIGPRTTIAALSDLSDFTGDTWQEVAAATGEKYRHFRATKDHPTADYKPCIKTPEHLSVIHGTGSHFPLGALGLPVNYKGSNAVNVFAGGEQSRRASPLWFRFVEDTESGKWRLFSFAFHTAFLPPDTDLRIRVKRKDIRDPDKMKIVEVTDADVRQRTQRWMSETTAGKTPDPDQ